MPGSSVGTAVPARPCWIDFTIALFDDEVLGNLRVYPVYFQYQDVVTEAYGWRGAALQPLRHRCTLCQRRVRKWMCIREHAQKQYHRAYGKRRENGACVYAGEGRYESMTPVRTQASAGWIEKQRAGNQGKEGAASRRRIRHGGLRSEQ